MKNIILFLLALTGCVAQSREVGTLSNRDIVTTLTELTNTVDSIQGNISQLENSVDTKLDLKQDKLNSSSTISISNNTVSVITSVPSPTIEKGRVADAYYTYQQMRNSAIDSYNALLIARETNSRADSISDRLEDVNSELRGLISNNQTLILDSTESLSNKVEESFVSTSNIIEDVNSELRELITNNSNAISSTSESLSGSISSLSNTTYNAIASVKDDISIQIQNHNTSEDPHENRFSKQMEIVESNYVQKASMPDYLKDYVKFDEISGEIDLSDYVTSNQLASAISNVQTKIEFNDTISESNGVYGVNLYKITGLTVPNYGYVADAKSAQDYANLLFSGISEIYVKKSAYNLFYSDANQRLFTLERDLPLLENRVDAIENKESIVVIPDAYRPYGLAADSKYVYDNFAILWNSTNTLNQATKTLKMSYDALDNRIDGVRGELEEKADKRDIRAYDNLVYMKQLVTNATWTINLEVVHGSGVFITSENANLVLMETFDTTIGNPTTSNNLREEVVEVWQGMSDKSGYFCQLEYVLIGRNTGIENRKFRLTVNSDFVFNFKLSELISADTFPSSFEISGSSIYTDINNSYRITTTGTLNNNAPVTMPLACRFALETPFLSLDTLNSNKADKVDVPTFARLEERLTQFYANIMTEVNTALDNKAQSVYDGMVGTIILCPYMNVEDLPYRVLKCDGTMYNKDDDGGKYLKLFNKIGTFYGGNESSGDFQVPNIAPLTSKATITSSSGSYEYTFDYYYYIIY